ncbi:pPIWI_RE module domain-containing protein [Nostoc sp. 2RC]|uniref:pPIWI_RE module domain-containing protein n=1 Tax=Nostoc sp. 2RC TaxID=2485484 RepID=UPI00162816C7|nr:DUF3962 domain-containing protein [Nostoc sp. 2RC]MBC1238674.1 DUF3962 domain-containing protein [Nostoc sp. 2RC]
MASKSNSIQLFALQVPTQISLPFKLYSLTVPQDWKKLFNRLQERKNGKGYISLPIENLNHALQLLLDDEILFPSKNAFKLKSYAKWLYSKTDNVSTDYIATVVKTWLRICLENTKSLTEADIAEINSLSGDDLHFEEVQLPEKVWTIEDAQLKINPLYYNLIPYLLASAIASEPLELIDPTTGKVFKEVVFRPCAVDNGDVAELISWTPELEIKEVTNKETNKKSKTTHNYSYLISFALHYAADGKPYISCNYGIRRWVNWELGFLSSRVTVYVSPTNSTRFAPCQLKFVKKKKDADNKKNGDDKKNDDKKKNIDFEGHLARLISELNFRDKFTALEVINNPCKQDDLAWGIVYNNTMSHSHNAGAGLFPQDIEIFYNCCREKIQEVFGDAFPTIETYTRCDNKQAVKKTSSEYKALGKFIKSHFAVESEDIPFYIPQDLRLILLSQTTASNKLIHALASKYGINDVFVYELGANGAELIGENWDSKCKERIKKILNTLETNYASSNQQTITLIEILPKEHFWRDTSEDPKPCLRPALAMLGSVTDHFVAKDDSEDDRQDALTEEELNNAIHEREETIEANKQEGKFEKISLKSNLAYRMESSLKSLLSMAGAYTIPTIEAENFPADVASCGVYLIPYYIGDSTKYLPVAVQMDKTGITAKAFGCDKWFDFHTFQVKMASGLKEIPPIDLNPSKIQSWVFNNLFQECQQPTLFCFDTTNLRKRGLVFLQKQFWQKHCLAFSPDKDKPISFISTSDYPHIRVASIIAPNNEHEVPLYRVCDEDGELKGHTAGVFYPSSLDSECGNYYLSNQRPESRSGGILNESKLVYLPKTRGDNKGELKKPSPRAQGYNPRGIFLNLTLQSSDCFSDWANYAQCLRLYGLIQYLDATIFPAPLHLAAGLDAYRPIQAIREP